MEETKKQSSPLAGFDFRWNARAEGRDEYTPEDIKEFLKGRVKHYVFQLEKGDGGLLHYQGRVSLIKRRRYTPSLVLRLWTDSKKRPNFFKPTCNPEFYKGDAFYQMKLDTRVAGPWTDKDEIKILTKQLKLFKGMTLRPYQQAIYDECSKFDMRKINLIWDTTGNCGKSILSEYLEYEGLAEEIPPFRLMDDIFAWVASRPIKRAYLVDMPRGMKKDRLGDFYSGIEVVKNGVAYDKRYNAKKVRFDRPRIFVFTNCLPNLELMSQDRWVIWKITEKYEIEVIK